MAKKKRRIMTFEEWLKKQKRGAVMEPGTFASIAGGAKGKGGKKLSAERRQAIAGSAYWKTAKAKYRAYVKRAKKR
jgi:hypothetical protein